MRRNLIERLARLEVGIGVTSGDWDAAQERMRCRYTLLLDAKSRASWEILQPLQVASEDGSPLKAYEPAI